MSLVNIQTNLGLTSTFVSVSNGSTEKLLQIVPTYDTKVKTNYIAGNPPEDILHNISENHQQQIQWYKKHLLKSTHFQQLTMKPYAQS